MLFTNKEINILPPLFYHDSVIRRISQHTSLGIRYDHAFTFKYHISNLILKLSRTMSLLYQVKNSVPGYVLLILYNAHVLPHLRYCTPIWSNPYPTHLLPLFRLQKIIIRILTNSVYYAHTQPLFKEVNVLKTFDMHKLQIGIYMFTLANRSNNLPASQQHNYPTRTRDNLRTPLHHLTIYKYSLAYTGPQIWNYVPNHIKHRQHFTFLKQQFKNM